MKTSVINRLALPGAMAILLLLSLAYWWLENLPHEILGSAFFALLAWHIVANRRWFRRLFMGRYDFRRTVTLVLHLLLILNMGTLAVTSVVISKSLFEFLPIPDSFLLHDIHWFSAYWVTILVGVHLGLHWARVMGTVRSKLGLLHTSPARTFILRIATLMIAGFGAWSFTVLGVWTKLTFTYSVDFWDFTTSVTPFFGHWAGVVSLPAIGTHYAIVLLRNRHRPAPSENSQAAV